MEQELEKQLEEVEKEGADKGREIASQDDFMTVYIDVSLPFLQPLSSSSCCSCMRTIQCLWVDAIARMDCRRSTRSK